MAGLTTFSDADLELLKKFIQQLKDQSVNQGSREGPAPLRNTPDVYVIYTPAGGIPSRDRFRPGSVDCQIYRVINGLLEVTGLPLRTVYNVGYQKVEGHQFVRITRDKFGTWFSDTCLLCSFDDADPYTGTGTGTGSIITPDPGTGTGTGGPTVPGDCECIDEPIPQTLHGTLTASGGGCAALNGLTTTFTYHAGATHGYWCGTFLIPSCGMYVWNVALICSGVQLALSSSIANGLLVCSESGGFGGSVSRNTLNCSPFVLTRVFNFINDCCAGTFVLTITE